MSSEPPVTSTSARPAIDIAATIRGILATYLHRPLHEVGLDSRLELDLELDSFAMIEIMIALETDLHFSMEHVADAHDLNLMTVGDLVAYVSSRLTA